MSAPAVPAEVISGRDGGNPPIPDETPSIVIDSENPTAPDESPYAVIDEDQSDETTV